MKKEDIVDYDAEQLLAIHRTEKSHNITLTEMDRLVFKLGFNAGVLHGMDKFKKSFENGRKK